MHERRMIEGLSWLDSAAAADSPHCELPVECHYVKCTSDQVHVGAATDESELWNHTSYSWNIGLFKVPPRCLYVLKSGFLHTFLYIRTFICADWTLSATFLLIIIITRSIGMCSGIAIWLCETMWNDSSKVSWWAPAVCIKDSRVFCSLLFSLFYRKSSLADVYFNVEKWFLASLWISIRWMDDIEFLVFL